MSKKNIIWIQFTSLSVCRHLLPIAMLLTMMQHLLLSKRMQESFWLLFRRKRFLHYSKTICYPLSAFSLPAGLWWKWLRIRSFFHRKCMQKWQAEAKHFCLSVRKCTLTDYFFLCGLIAQNTIFIMITISRTAAMDTQNPMLIPSHSHVPKSFIQSIFQFILFTS